MDVNKGGDCSFGQEEVGGTCANIRVHSTKIPDQIFNQSQTNSPEIISFMMLMTMGRPLTMAEPLLPALLTCGFSPIVFSGQSGGERGARGGEWVQGGASVPNCYLPLLNLQKTQWNYGAGPKDHRQAPTVDNSLPPPSSGQDKQTPNPILSLPITFLIWNTSASDCWQLVVLKNSQHSCSKQGGGEGVKGRLNNVKKICTIGEGRLP